MTAYNLLYCSPLVKDTGLLNMYRAFKRVKNLDVYSLFDESNIIEPQNYWRSLPITYRILNKIGFPSDLYGINKTILDLTFKKKFDFLFIPDGRVIRPCTLKKIKRICPDSILIHWSNDNLFLPHYKSIFFLRSLRYYDLFVVINIPSYIKSYENYDVKKNRILLIDKSFSIDFIKDYYEIIDCENSKLKYDVIFIGSYEEDRFEAIKYLANNGIEVNIFGGGWEHVKRVNEFMVIHNRQLIGKEYVEAIKCSKIVLGFLRKRNNDTQTSRSFEIPAYGGFMLAERTKDHLRLFKEGMEAEFFSNKEELLYKVEYYLNNDTQRRKIAWNGQMKCFLADYSFDNRVHKIVEKAIKIKLRNENVYS